MSVVALVALVAAWGACPAHAQGDEVEATYREAIALEAAGEPAQALSAWTAVIEAAPGTRLAARAERRRAWLTDRAENGFAPLTALMSFQALDDPSEATLSAFASEIDAMPEGRVRIEARLVLAAAWARRGEGELAVSQYRALADEPGLRDDEARLARDELAGALASSGDTAGALAELEAAGLADGGRHGVLMRAARRRFLEPLAWSLIALFVVLSVATIQASSLGRRALRAVVDPAVLALAGTLAIGPYALALLAADEATDSFGVFGLANACALLLVFATASAIPPSPTRRRLTSVISASFVSTVFSSGYLVVIYTAPSLPFA